MKTIHIRTDSVLGPNDRFWAACGIDELFAYLPTQAGEFLTARMQRHGTCRFMRCHYTLNDEVVEGPDGVPLRIGGDVYSEDADGNPVYDFAWINDKFARMLSYGIRPIVELDFMPSALIGEAGRVTQEGFGHVQSNRYIPKDWDKWQALLTAFVQNLADTFGCDELRLWYFEVWNEPDSWPVEAWPNFFRLYDVFAAAVKSVDPTLRVGGPASFKQPLFYAFLDHAAKTGVPLDFISYHIYGMSGAWLPEYPLVMPTVQRFVQELLWVQRAIDAFPELSGTELQLNEWGVVSNYERDRHRYPALELRDSEFSALFAVKLVDCLTSLRRAYGLPLSMALFWAFCNEDVAGTLFNGNRSLTTAYHIAKPVQTAFELLARLGPELIAADGIRPGADEGVIAARSAHGAQALLYHFCECCAFAEYDPDGAIPPREYDLRFSGLPDGLYRLRAYTLDRAHHNTYRLWQRMGAPERPDAEQLRRLHAEQELVPEEATVEVCGGVCACTVTLASGAMQLVEVEPVPIADGP